MILTLQGVLLFVLMKVHRRLFPNITSMELEVISNMLMSFIILKVGHASRVLPLHILHYHITDMNDVLFIFLASGICSIVFPLSGCVKYFLSVYYEVPGESGRYCLFQDGTVFFCH